MKIFSKMKKAFTIAEMSVTMAISVFIMYQSSNIIHNMSIQKALGEDKERVKTLINDFIQDINTGYRRSDTYCGNNSYHLISAVKISNCIVDNTYSASDNTRYINDRFFKLVVKTGVTDTNNNTSGEDSYFARDTSIPFRIYIERDQNNADNYYMYVAVDQGANVTSAKDRALFEEEMYPAIANFVSANLKDEFPTIENWVNQTNNTASGNLSTYANLNSNNDGGTEYDGVFAFKIGF